MGQLPFKRYRKHILKRDDLTLAELQSLTLLIARSHPKAAKRVRALLLKGLGRSSDYVHQTVGICARQYFRWLNWYEEQGLRGLLNEFTRHFRQCPRCEGFGAVTDHFSPTSPICRPCDAARKRVWRRTPEGRRACHRYDRSPARYRSIARYRSTEAGRAMRLREYERRLLASVRAP